MKAQAVSKAGIKIERLMEEDRKIRNQVKKLISIFQGPLFFKVNIISGTWAYTPIGRISSRPLLFSPQGNSNR